MPSIILSVRVQAIVATAANAGRRRGLGERKASILFSESCVSIVAEDTVVAENLGLV